MKNAYHLSTLILVGALAACAETPQEDQNATAEAASAESVPEAVAEPMGTVSILEPADGSVLMSDEIVVRLSADGYQIVPAGEIVEGTGHHHLYLDADLTDGTVPVPSIPDRVIHMGNGASEYTFSNVGPGEHRLIAVLANGVHMPIQPWVVDTVTFTVSN